MGARSLTKVGGVGNYKRVPTDTKSEARKSRRSEKAESRKKCLQGDAECADRPREEESNICIAVMNLSSRILIAVIIGVPYALKEAGFGLGIILTLVIAFLTDYTLGLLIKAGELAKTKTYLGVMEAAFGKFGVSGVLFKQFVYPFIIMIASNTIIGDILVRLVSAIAQHNHLGEVKGKIYGNRQFLIGIVTLVITLPLSLYRHVNHMGKYAGLSILFLFTVIIFTIVRLGTLDLPNTPNAYKFADIDAFRAMGILIAVYMCHHSSFLIFNSMIRPTTYRQREAAHISVAFSMAVTLTLGIVVYATFTGDTYGNFLNNYCSTDILMSVGRGLYIFSVILAFPGEVAVARLVVEEAFFSGPTPIWRHVMVTVFLLGGSVGATYITPCLSILLELNGVANAAPLAFIFPPVLVMKLQKTPLCSWSNAPMIITLAIGIGITGFGIYRTIMTIIDGVECARGREPAFCLPDAIADNVTQIMTTI